MCTETRLKENVTFFFSHSEFRYSRIYIISILNYNKQKCFDIIRLLRIVRRKILTSNSLLQIKLIEIKNYRIILNKIIICILYLFTTKVYLQTVRNTAQTQKIPNLEFIFTKSAIKRLTNKITIYCTLYTLLVHVEN